MENKNNNYKKSEKTPEIKAENGKYSSSDTSLKTVLTELNKVAPPKKKDPEPKLQPTLTIPNTDPFLKDEKPADVKPKEKVLTKLEKNSQRRKKTKVKKRRKGGSDHKGKKPMNLSYSSSKN